MSSTTEESAFRETLSIVLEKVRASKVAFYLLEPTGTFRLAATYGFGRGDRLPDRISRTDALMEFVVEKREVSFVNESRTGGRLQAFVDAAGAVRILVAPLYLEARIAGVLLLFDKAGYEPFTAADIPWTQEALRRLSLGVRNLRQFAEPVLEAPPEISVFEQTGAFRKLPAPPAGAGRREPGVQSIPYETERLALSGLPPRPAGLAPFDRDATGLSGSTDPFPNSTDRLLQLIEERIAAAPRKKTAEPSSTSSARDAAFFRMFNEALLHLPDVEVAALSVYEPAGIQVWYASRRPFADDAEGVFSENVDRVFAKLNPRFTPASQRTTHPVYPAAESAEGSLRLSDLGAVQSSVISSGPSEATVFTFIFRRGSRPEEQAGTRAVHVLVKNTLVEIRSSVRYREIYRGLVSLLLEPGLKRYTALKTHSLNVGRMARKFATHLGLGPSEIEQFTVAGILHDVGMRELGYEEIYGKKSLSETETNFVRQHPRVGAFLLEGINWPYPITPLILHHHERWDGGGYPAGLRAEEIPLGSRVIHLCEVFDMMTSPTSYRSILSIPQALEIISSKRGTQFDPELTPAFVELAENLGT